MSPFSLSVHHGPYLLLVATGEARLSDLLGLVDLAKRIVEIEGHKRVLADLISITVQFSDDEFRQLQMYAAKTLSSLEQLAYTVPACYNKGKADPPITVNGVVVRSFSDLAHACAWMTS
jgi:hypothetical protein